MSSPTKVLLIGWDAADWKVITPLLDRGEMPNLSRFLDTGVMGNLATLQPMLSPMLWTSIATGKRAHKHGIHGFSEPTADGAGVRPVTNLGRKTKAIWNILQQNGKRSNVVGWWPSQPVEPISGVMVSDLYHKATAELGQPWPLRPGSVHPPRLAEPLAKLRVHPWELDQDILRSFVPAVADIDQEQDKRLMNVAKVLAEAASVHAAATALMQLEPWDFMAVYFDAIDHFCHGFMQYHPPRLPWVAERDFELYKDVVASGYRFHDLMLGAYMELAGDDTHIILVSDHGFHPDHLRPRELPNEPAGPAEEHRPFGILAMRGPQLRQDELVFGAGLLDITPTILSLFGLPLGADMDGKPLASAFREPPTPDTIPSWDSVPGDAGLHPPDRQVAPVDDSEALAQLVELGYIEAPDADRQTAVDNTVKELRYNLARDYLDAHRIPEAMAVLEDLWQRWPEEGRFGIKLFDANLALGRGAAARQVLDRVVANKKKFAAEALEELKKLREEIGDAKPEDLDEAQRNKERKLRKKAHTNRHTLAYLEGRLLHAEGRHEQAIEALRRAEQVQIHNRPSLYQQIGQCHLALKQWQAAAIEFQRALDIDPVNPDAQLGLSRALLGQRRNKKALAAAQAALGLRYHFPEGHLACAIALQRLRRFDEARQALQTAIAQNPVFPSAHRRLAKLYQKRFGDPQRAAEHRRLAKQAKARIRAFRAGEVLPRQAGMDAVEAAEAASLGCFDVGGEPVPLPAEAVVVVSGLPRSGTSMMMQMLRAGGLPLFSDEHRPADADNPRGYYEHQRAKALGRGDDAWLAEAEGRVIKLVAQLLPRLPAGRPYRILFMERPLGEVLASQGAMLERLGREAGNPAKLAASYRRQVDAVRKLLAHHADRQGRRIQVLSVPYHDTLADPAAAAARVNRFLGGGLDEAAMAAAVDAGLRRQRGHSAPVGEGLTA